MTRTWSIGRVKVNLDQPCRVCRRPMPITSLEDGHGTHPACDWSPSSYRR